MVFMGATKKGEVESLAALVREEAKSLKPTDVARLVRHPRAVRRALAFAAETLAEDVRPEPARVEVIGRGKRPTKVKAAEARRRLEARTRTLEVPSLLSSEEFAKKAGLKNRQSVHNWFKKGRVVGWAGAKRGLVFPADQLDERGRLVEGLKDVLPFFPEGYAAWGWLTTPLMALDDETPLSRLREGEVERVLEAARGDAQGDFA